MFVVYYITNSYSFVVYSLKLFYVPIVLCRVCIENEFLWLDFLVCALRLNVGKKMLKISWF